MAIRFSSQVMRNMGFREFAEDEVLSATFSSITVYEARGIILDSGNYNVLDGSVANLTYLLSVNISVNNACLALVNEEFVENEDDWKNENKCQGPFVLIKIGPTIEHTCIKGFIKTEEDGSFTTLDCFPGVRAELAQLEARVLPALLSALTCSLNKKDKYVALRKITRALFGYTTIGIGIHDIHAECHMELFSAYKLDEGELSEKLETAVTLAPKLNQKACKFFALGLTETDRLKRFLFFFLSLEIETHAVFAQINHEESLRKILGNEQYRLNQATQLIQKQVNRLTRLYDRFVLCSESVWTNLDDDDVLQFKRLKEVRDKIAHGSISEPPPLYDRMAETLAHKVLWNSENLKTR